jgi:peptidyl-prolyl cis-trans isomerase C
MHRLQRSKPVLAILAVVLLCLPGSAVAQTDDPVLIELGATRERVSFVVERFEIAVRGVAANQGLPYTPEVFAQLYPFLPNFLEQRASELVLIDYARTRGLEVPEGRIDEIVADVRATTGNDDDAFARLLTEAGFRDEDQLRRLIEESELVQVAFEAIQAGVVVSEAEMRVSYQGTRERYVVPAEVCAKHILVAELDEAEAVVERLEAGEDFAEVAAEVSRDTGSAARGGELGCLPQGATVPAFDDAAFGAEVGVLTGPVQTQFGYHLLMVDERIDARQRAFDEVRDQIERELRGARAELALQRAIEIAGVRTYPERIPPLPDAEQD